MDTYVVELTNRELHVLRNVLRRSNKELNKVIDEAELLFYNSKKEKYRKMLEDLLESHKIREALRIKLRDIKDPDGTKRLSAANNKHNIKYVEEKEKEYDVKCSYCGERAELVDGSVIYPNMYKCDHLKFWLCRDCDAYVGTYKDGKPVGTLAKADLRKARVDAHEAFDPLWQNGKMSRSQAYKVMAEWLDIPRKECHIGKFDLDMCNRVRELFKNTNIGIGE